MKTTTAPFTVVRQPIFRRLIRDIGRRGQHRHTVHGLVEIDVTEPRQRIEAYKARTGEAISFTGFIIACLGQALEDAKRLQAYRNWRNQLVIFDEVDVSTMVEVQVEGRQQFVPHIIRAANRKTVRQIHDEIRAAQVKPPVKQRMSLMRGVARLPRIFRSLLYRVLDRSPHLEKEYCGTVAVSALGMFGHGSGWAIVISNHTLSVAIGGIAAKPGVVAGEIAIREYLCLTLSFDHDLIDGGPAARFIERFKEMIEQGVGLDDL